MSWNDINLSKEIPLEVKKPKLEAGRVTAMIVPGATVDIAGTLFVEASVVAPGRFAGRQIKLRYRDPNKRSKFGKPMAWIAQAFQQLLSAVNLEPKPNETPVAAVHRAAGRQFSVELTPFTNQYGKTFVAPDILTVEAVSE